MSLGGRILGWYGAGHRGTAKALAAALGEPLWDVRLALSGLFVKGDVALIDYEGKLNAPIFAATGTTIVSAKPRPVRDDAEPVTGARQAKAARREQDTGHAEPRDTQPGLFDP